MSVSHCLLGCPVGESLCQVSDLWSISSLWPIKIKYFLKFRLYCIINWIWKPLLSIHLRLHGSYEQLWAGQVSEALVDVTGGLAERWSLGHSGMEVEQRPEQDGYQVTRRRLDLKHLSSLKDQCAISCSTHRSAGGQEALFCWCLLSWSHLMISLTSLGAAEVGQYHAMTVMEWQDVTSVSGSKVLLLRIRNPWGRSCWGGAWTQGYACF